MIIRAHPLRSPEPRPSPAAGPRSVPDTQFDVGQKSRMSPIHQSLAPKTLIVTRPPAPSTPKRAHSSAQRWPKQATTPARAVLGPSQTLIPSFTTSPAAPKSSSRTLSPPSGASSSVTATRASFTVTPPPFTVTPPPFTVTPPPLTVPPPPSPHPAWDSVGLPPFTLTPPSLEVTLPSFTVTPPPLDLSAHGLATVTPPPMTVTPPPLVITPPPLVVTPPALGPDSNSITVTLPSLTVTPPPLTVTTPPLIVTPPPL
ncbi:uncharacterized protein [Petaurus breviceps papuanus]|uniref:uncharacterized protein n=1 Tax=Petaurus breviceps papuanus TaxID=3040969 RepID=UPI0036D8C38C